MISISKFKNWNQGKLGACVGYSAANALWAQAKIDLDPVKLYNRARKMFKRPDNPNDPNDDGLYVKEIAGLLRTDGYKAILLSKNLSAVQLWLDRGVPVVVAVKAQYISPQHDSGWHAVVLYKYEKNGLVYFANSWNPTWGPYNNNTGYFLWDPKMIKWCYIVTTKKIYDKVSGT